MARSRWHQDLNRLSTKVSDVQEFPSGKCDPRSQFSQSVCRRPFWEGLRSSHSLTESARLHTMCHMLQACWRKSYILHSKGLQVSWCYPTWDWGYPQGLEGYPCSLWHEWDFLMKIWLVNTLMESKPTTLGCLAILSRPCWTLSNGQFSWVFLFTSSLLATGWRLLILCLSFLKLLICATGD